MSRTPTWPADVEVLRLYARYNETIDQGDAGAWSELWVEDGVFEHPANTYVGRAALHDFVVARQEGLGAHRLTGHAHWNRDIRLDLADAGEGHGGCRVVITGRGRDTGAEEIVGVGAYEDHVVRRGGAWLFARRRLVLDSVHVPG